MKKGLKILILLFGFMVFLAGGETQAAYYNPDTSAHILLSSYYLYPKDNLTVIGRMFAGGEKVEVSFGRQVQIVRASNEGEFRIRNFIVPTGAIGSNLRIRARGLSSGVVREAQVVVGEYYPFVRPTSYYVRPGEVVSFKGQNFAPSEMVNVKLGSKFIDSFPVDASGNFHVVLSPFPQTSSDVAYSFTGLLSRRTFLVVITPAKERAQAQFQKIDFPHPAKVIQNYPPWADSFG